MNRTQDCLIFGIWSLNECFLSLSLFPFSPGLLSYNINWYVVYVFMTSCVCPVIYIYLYMGDWLSTVLLMKIAFHVVFWTIVFLEGEGSLLHPSQIYKCHRHRQWLDVPRKPLPEFPKITLVKKETLLCWYLIGVLNTRTNALWKSINVSQQSRYHMWQH